jgi:hypothetical protein
MPLDVTFSSASYRSDLAWVRKLISMNRGGPTLTVRLLPDSKTTNVAGSLTVYIRPSDVYLIGMVLGGEDYYFNGEPTPHGAGKIEFGAGYPDLNPGWVNRIELSVFTLANAVALLGSHRTGNRGTGLLQEHKEALIRIIFSVSEALRYWTIERDVNNVLSGSPHSLNINDYAGSGKPLNTWAEWSKQPDAPMHGIFLPHRDADWA